MTEADFDRVFKTYNKSLVHFGMSILYEPYLGEDIVSEVMVKLYSRMGDFQKEEQVSKWLYVSVKNAAINANKHTIIKQKTIYEFPDMTEEDIDDKLTKSKLLEMVLNGIKSAPKGQRKVMELRYQGLSNIEISQVLGISIDTIRVQIKRFRDSLRLSI